MRWERDQAVFSYSRGKVLGYCLMSAAFAAGCTWLWHKGVAAPGSYKEFVLMLGGPFFGIGTAISLARLFGNPEVLFVDREGILDSRISDSKLPWRMITNLSVAGIHRQKFLMVQLAPQFEATLQKTRMARLGGPSNAALGLKGMAIPTQGLDGTLDDLLEAVRRFSVR